MPARPWRTCAMCSTTWPERRRSAGDPAVAGGRAHHFFGGEPITWASTVGRCASWRCASSHSCRDSGGAPPSNPLRSAHGGADR
jgi:hypothetical protein